MGLGLSLRHPWESWTQGGREWNWGIREDGLTLLTGEGFGVR